MISEKGFVHRVQTDILPNLQHIEKERKNLIFKSVLFCILSCITILLPFAYFFFFAFFVITIFRLNNLYKKAKKKIFLLLINIFDNLNVENKLNKRILEQSFLFPKFNRIIQDYALSGNLKKTDCLISKIKLRQVNNSNEITDFVFNGILIYIPLKKTLSGYTLLSSNKQNFLPVLEKIHLEDIVFHKNYYVCSDNQIEARSLLTPIFMEKLKSLKNYFKNNRLEASFFGNHLIIAIYTRRNLFKPFYLFRDINNIKTYQDFYKDIELFYNSINALSIENKSLPLKESRTYHKTYKKISYLSKKRNIIFNILFLLVYFLILLLPIGDKDLKTFIFFVILIVCNITYKHFPSIQ